MDVEKTLAHQGVSGRISASMTRASKVATGFLSRFSVQLFAAASVGPLLAWLVGATLPRRIESPFVAVLFSIVVCSLGVAVAIGVYLVNRDNRRLKDCASELHSINHIYRDALSGLLAIEGRAKTGSEVDKAKADRDRLLFERTVLNRVCEKVANMFDNLTGRKCVVTVKLAVMEKEERKFCFTWARSEPDIYREELPDTEYSLLTGANTGLDEALRFRPSGPSFFHSADLWSDPNYQNERKGWRRLYRSTIVVPIRRVFRGNSQQVDLIGFLCVDTTSAHRLNDTYEVEFLAAFADQMYNFVSIVRGKYSLPDRNQETAAWPTHKLAHETSRDEPMV